MNTPLQQAYRTAIMNLYNCVHFWYGYLDTWGTTLPLQRKESIQNHIDYLKNQIRQLKDDLHLYEQ